MRDIFHAYKIRDFLKDSKSLGCVESFKTFIVLRISLRLCRLRTVSVKVDTTKIRIGEQFNYQIIVDQTEDVRFPKFESDSLNRIGVVTAHKIDSLKNQLIKKYTLTSFDSGRYVLPGQEIFIKDKRFLTDPVIIDVATVAVDTIKQQCIPLRQFKVNLIPLVII